MKKILWAIGFLTIYLLLLSFWGFYISVKPAKIVTNITPSDIGLKYEDIAFETSDGVTLKGWFITHKNEAEAKTIIALHGYPADKGDILRSLAFLNERYNLFLFDFRYMGQSEGKYTTLGKKEVNDMRAAIRYLKLRGIEEVGVWGNSMGAAVGIMSAAEMPEIKAVVAKSSYARLDLMTEEMYRLPLLDKILAGLTHGWGRLILGLSPKEVAPLAAAKQLNIPILLIHSKQDQVIPFRHFLLLQESLKENPLAEFWVQENLTHQDITEEHENRVREFFLRNF